MNENIKLRGIYKTLVTQYVKAYKSEENEIEFGRDLDKVAFSLKFFAKPSYMRKMDIERLENIDKQAAGLLKKINKRYNRMAVGKKIMDILTFPTHLPASIVATCSIPTILVAAGGLAICASTPSRRGFWNGVGRVAGYTVGGAITAAGAVASAGILAGAAVIDIPREISDARFGAKTDGFINDVGFSYDYINATLEKNGTNAEEFFDYESDIDGEAYKKATQTPFAASLESAMDKSK